MVRTNTKRKANHMIKKQLKFLILLSLISFQGVSSSENNIYNKIDLFGEVLEKINKDTMTRDAYAQAPWLNFRVLRGKFT